MQTFSESKESSTHAVSPRFHSILPSREGAEGWLSLTLRVPFPEREVGEVRGPQSGLCHADNGSWSVTVISRSGNKERKQYSWY